jgi:Cu-Zn family superoxide dismutase
MKKTCCALAASALLLGACATPTEVEGPWAVADLVAPSKSELAGTVTFAQIGKERVRVTGNITGHSPGEKGFHIHEKGECTAPDFTSAGGHFNPMKMKHGATPRTGHVGDMGNLTFNAAGIATINMVLEGITLDRDASTGIIGRAVVIHVQPDDLVTDPTGNAGGRAACGVIR